VPGLVRVLRALALLVAIAAPAGAQQEDVPSLSSARVAAQIATGALLTPIAFFGTGYLTDRVFAHDPKSETVRRFQYVASFTATWLAAAAGPAMVGRDGRFPVALAGSMAGMGGSLLTAQLGNVLFDDGRRSCGVLCWSLGALTVALPSIGATIAYNASR
jgi:hypothetical protein